MHALLVLCLLGFVATQVPVPCTTPPQWEGRIFETNEMERLMIRGRLSYDAAYHRERFLDDIEVGQQESFYDTIALFDSRIEYVYSFRNRSCTRRPLTRAWRDFGIRPDARSMGEGYIGTSALPGSGILVSLWGGNYTGPANDTVTTFASWTYQGCLPVRRISRSSQFGRTELSFYDITVGISNPSVFIPRPECFVD